MRRLQKLHERERKEDKIRLLADAILNYESNEIKKTQKYRAGLVLFNDNLLFLLDELMIRL
jgi:hypothetical protein